MLTVIVSEAAVKLCDGVLFSRTSTSSDDEAREALIPVLFYSIRGSACIDNEILLSQQISEHQRHSARPPWCLPTARKVLES